MSKRYEGMTKVPDMPAARMLAEHGFELDTRVKAPASAKPEAVLAELDDAQAWPDVLKVLAAILPARERIWWACLAARDLPGTDPDKPHAALAAAEDWVRRPTAENRERAQAALDHLKPKDPMGKLAMAVVYAEGTLGPGELSEMPAPPGGSQIMALMVNVDALKARREESKVYTQLVIDRAVDIARGGNGKIETVTAGEEG
ncbi:hypothetical protein SAMN05444007_11266 [Cribrihabitans marinus]|uniref:Uncharacterized protein n=1 Tax=Cribrihabitans marinus TaxID=1227549 RepID=A0A1H7DN83_9RHOB|nr:hypothetical protein [Cribrihabitans marinus]SEK03271.1 hypothetical protein SAMN05444007_11266 [Cribrihabitans marinus]